MADITQIWLIAATSDDKNSDSNSHLELQVAMDGVVAELKTSDDTSKYGSKDNTGDCAQWTWTSDFWDGDLQTGPTASDFDLEILANNAWLPVSVWVTTLDSDGNYAMPVSIPNWPTADVLSTDSSEGKSSYNLGDVS